MKREVIEKFYEKLELDGWDDVINYIKVVAKDYKIETLCKIYELAYNLAEDGDIDGGDCYDVRALAIDRICKIVDKYAEELDGMLTDDQVGELCEVLAEKTLCNKGCVCPHYKSVGLCSDCDAYYSVRDYYEHIFTGKSTKYILNEIKERKIDITEDEIYEIIKEN